MQKPKLLYIFSTYVSWRDSLFTGLIDALQEQYELVIASPHAGNAHMQDWAKEAGLPLHQVPAPEGTAFLSRYQKYIFSLWKWVATRKMARKYQIHTLLINEQQEKDLSAKSYKRKDFLWRILFRFSGPRNLLGWAYKASLNRQDLTAFYQKIGAQYVMFHDIFQPNQQAPQAVAQHMGLESIGLLRSWDNLSAKGAIMFPAKKYLVWNEIMETELLTWYPGVQKSDIGVVGGLVFDYHARLKTETSSFPFIYEAETRNKKVITFFLNYPDISPHYLENVKDLLAMLKAEGWDQTVSLIIRIQPGPRNRGQKENLLALDADFILDAPPDLLGEPDLEYLQKDINHLVQVVKASDVIINYPSTTTIDGAIFDIPSVTIGYDGPENLPYHHSLLRIIERTHYRPMAACKGNRIVFTPEAFTAAVHAYLQDPDLEQAGRKRILEKLLNDSVGKSVVLMMKQLARWTASGQTPDPSQVEAPLIQSS
ncbi:MAG: hypothetical protein AAFR61_13975 [Bacteroidota bacterium]